MAGMRVANRCNIQEGTQISPSSRVAPVGLRLFRDLPVN